MIRMRKIAWLVLVTIFGTGGPLSAQTPPPDDLLALVPKEFGFCLAVNDLRGHWQRLEQAPWIQALKQAPLGQAILNAPEFQDLAKFERDLKQHLGVDWPSLRDDVLGDTLVFAYRPPSAGDAEQGLVFVKPRRPEALSGLIGRLNELQKKAGELKELEEKSHRGVTYYRRVHAKNTHYYFRDGGVFGFATHEDVLRAALEQKATGGAIRLALHRAGAERAAAALWLNPRFFDAELAEKVRLALGAEGQVLQSFLEHWKALDAVVLSFDIKDDLELRMTLLARPGDLPPAAKAWFTRRGQVSELWQRFPANSVLTLAGRTDFKALADGLLEVAPAPIRKMLDDELRKTVGVAVGLDPFQDVLPNLGPDWGICLLPASAGKQFPQGLAALAVKPGSKSVAVDQSLFKALHLAVEFGKFAHNRGNNDGLQHLKMRQGDVEIWYLAQDKLFPAGFQPAYALKDGYLVLATSPAAIELFQRPKTEFATTDDIPILRVSPTELAQLLRLHRERVLEQVMQKNGQSRSAAGENLDGLLAVLDVCRQITVGQRAGDGQIAWSVRLQMARGTTP
jgi:hypothetical protein